jgi:SulP family sulfate permease
VTFLSTLFLDLEFAIYAGVVLSLVVYLNRTSRPPVHTLVPDRRDPARRYSVGEGQPECGQLKIIEVHGSLFFGAIDHVQQRLQEIDERAARHKHVLIVADGINFADIAGAEMLAREARRRRRMGGGLYLVGLKPRTLEVLRAGGYLDEIGEANVFDDRARAVEQIRRRLDPSECGGCDARVFEACERSTPARRAPRRAAAALESALSAAAFAEEGADAAAREVLSADVQRPPGHAGAERPDPPAPRRASGDGRRGSGTA